MFETGCCGADFRYERVSLTGLLTFSVPVVLIAAPAALLAAVLPAGSRPRRFARVMLNANLELIHQAALAPSLRCALAGLLYGISPRLSGAAYRSFNLFILFLPWAGAAGAVYFLVKA